MAEKYIAVSLDDEKTREIVDALGNKTGRKILNFLAERDASESEIASKLGMNLNTIEYNLKKLIKAGFIEKTKNFLWSRKGKKIEVYRLANKSILISPKKRTVTTVPLIAAGILGIFLLYLFFGVNFNSFERVQDFAGEKAASAESLTTAPTAVSSSVVYPYWAWILLGIWIALVGFIIWDLRKR
jgi:DNA-binding transcriptional ArsR family regulator